MKKTKQTKWVFIIFSLFLIILCRGYFPNFPVGKMKEEKIMETKKNLKVSNIPEFS